MSDATSLPSAAAANDAPRSLQASALHFVTLGVMGRFLPSPQTESPAADEHEVIHTQRLGRCW